MKQDEVNQQRIVNQDGSTVGIGMRATFFTLKGEIGEELAMKTLNLRYDEIDTGKVIQIDDITISDKFKDVIHIDKIGDNIICVIHHLKCYRVTLEVIDGVLHFYGVVKYIETIVDGEVTNIPQLGMVPCTTVMCDGVCVMYNWLHLSDELILSVNEEVINNKYVEVMKEM